MTSPVRAPRPTPRGLPALPTPTARPDLRVVGDPVRRSRTGLSVALSVIVVFGALILVAMAHSLSVSGQAHLDQVNGQVRNERVLLQREQLRLANVESPARITSEALRIGMVPSEQQNWLSPGTDPSAVGTDGPAQAGTPDGQSGGSSGGSELAASNDGAAIQR